MSEATPRPWKNPDLGELFPVWVAGRDFDPTASPVVQLIAAMHDDGDISRAECRANAALIVRAVNNYDNMREACGQAIIYLGDQEAIDGYAGSLGGVGKEAILAVLRKAYAEKEQP